MRIRFHSDADAELAEAREWYAHQRKDLDAEFMQCIDDTLSRIARDPSLYPIVYRSLRRDSHSGGFPFWLGQVNSGPLRDTTKQHAMVCSFITRLNISSDSSQS